VRSRAAAWTWSRRSSWVASTLSRLVATASSPVSSEPDVAVDELGELQEGLGARGLNLLLRGPPGQLPTQVPGHVGAELVVVDDLGKQVELAEHVVAVNPGIVLGEHVGRGEDDEVSVDPRQLVGAGHPRLGAVVERGAGHGDGPQVVGLEVLLCELFGVAQQEVLDEVGGEVGDAVAADAPLDEGELLDVTGVGDGLVAEVAQ